jgi:hypothetical protein
MSRSTISGWRAPIDAGIEAAFAAEAGNLVKCASLASGNLTRIRLILLWDKLFDSEFS